MFFTHTLFTHTHTHTHTHTQTTLQTINKWIGGGAKLRLTRSPDGDVLKDIIIKLQRRVKTGTVTLLIKVKVHRGDLSTFDQKWDTERGEQKDMERSDQSNDLPMVRTLQDQERDSHHKNVTVDPHCPKPHVTESTGNSSI